MRKSVKIKASPHLLKKLRENSGYTEEELANRLGVTAEKIVKVEKGEDSFTVTQIKKLADIYKVPLAAFFSKEVPDVPSLPDYRINREKKLNPEVFVAIRRAKYLSEEVRELSGKKSEIPSFPDSSPEELAKKFREYLKIEAPKFKSPNEALEFYKNILEGRLGIMVVEYPLKAEDVRAFSLRSELSVIVLNESDEPQVKLFSLFHEIAHLLKHGNGICSIDVSEERDEIERFCNKFAAEFLVPSNDLKRRVENRELSNKEISKLARLYGVSMQVMMLRLFDLRYITRDDYYRFKEKFDESKLKRKGGRRDWEKTYSNRVGKMALSEVSRAYRKGDISFFEAVKILDVNTKYAEKLLG